MELLILFPFDMAINQNLSNPAAQEALDQFFGIADWRKELRTSQLRNEEITQRRQRFTHVYVQNLRSLGYQYVEEYGPLHWRNRPLYSVIFATDHPVGAKIMRDVWSKPRSIPGQLDYAPVRRPNLP
jgi:three-Cys-motif partner protein